MHTRSFPRCLLPLLLAAFPACTEASDPPPDPNVPDAPTLSWSEHACAMTIPDGFDASDFRCGTADIPLDWSDPDSARITMAVAVLKSRSPEPSAAPLVYLGGGPGVPNLDNYLQRHAARLGPLNADRDIVFFDPRGVGHSTPRLSCPEHTDAFLSSYERDQSSADDGQDLLDGYAACYQRLVDDGVSPSHHDSATVARDVAALMEALGEDSYDLYGISYGGRFAQTMVRDVPDGVRRVILDGTIMPEISNAAFWPRNFDGSLDALVAACEADADCSAGHPDLRAALTTAVTTLNANPHVTTINTDDGPKDLYITGDRFLVGLHSAMYSRDLIGVVPLVISNAAAGNYALIDAFAPDLAPSDDDLDRGVYVSVLCAETFPYDDEAAIAAGKEGVDPDIARALGAINGDMFIEVCDVWQVERSAGDERAPVHGDAPVLVLSDTFDPASPPAYADRAVDNFTNARLVRTEGLGHGMLSNAPMDDATQSSCALDVLQQFLDNPDADVDDSCVDELPSPL